MLLTFEENFTMILTFQSDEFFMKEAIKEAKKALNLDEVPIGAVIVSNQRIIARGHNLTEQLNDVTAHAEMQAYTAAANFLGGKFLDECTLYVTIEPCAMCAGAAFWTRIGKIVFGAKDEKRGYNKLKGNLLHPKTEVLSGIMEKECGELITNYFKQKR
jgi:tRNA(adenine34) deaminase